MSAARRLFAERGYADVGTEEIVREAGVTRGALYHHFAGKRELMRAVYEQLEAELSAEFARSVTPGADPLTILRDGAETFLDQCLEPEVQQIALLDAPAVLGWEDWREINAKYALGLIEGVLRHGMDVGEIRTQADAAACARPDRRARRARDARRPLRGSGRGPGRGRPCDHHPGRGASNARVRGQSDRTRRVTKPAQTWPGRRANNRVASPIRGN